MIDWETKAKRLEEKVHILEETLDTVKKMRLSDEMNRYIQLRTSALRLVDLVNLSSDEEEDKINIDGYKLELQETITRKYEIDHQIGNAFNKAKNCLAQYSFDERYFDVELESATATNWRGDKVEIDSLKSYIGKGVRITAYKGKRRDVLVIPQEIKGHPVISIGENVFEKMSFSEIVIPPTVKIICKEAFKDCRLLKNISLPDELKYIGDGAFYGAGIESIIIPNGVEVLPSFSFAHCKLSYAKIGEGTKIIGAQAFLGCPLEKVVIPEGVEELRGNCFSSTKLNVIELPDSVKTVSPVAFADTLDRWKTDHVICAFVGRETIIENDDHFAAFPGVRMIYCWRGSAIEDYAKEHLIVTKYLEDL